MAMDEKALNRHLSQNDCGLTGGSDLQHSEAFLPAYFGELWPI